MHRAFGLYALGSVDVLDRLDVVHAARWCIFETTPGSSAARSNAMSREPEAPAAGVATPRRLRGIADDRVPEVLARFMNKGRP
jgi:hypothetical protein